MQSSEILIIFGLIIFALIIIFVYVNNRNKSRQNNVNEANNLQQPDVPVARPRDPQVTSPTDAPPQPQAPLSETMPKLSTFITKQTPDNIFSNQLAATFYRKPTVSYANDKYYVTYELFITNGGATPIVLKSINVDYENGKYVVTGETLAKDLVLFKMNSAIEEEFFQPESTTVESLEPGRTYVVYMQLNFDDKVPKKIQHTLVTENLEIKTDPVYIDRNTGPIIRPPLRGSGWLAVNAPSNDSIHRRSHIIGDGNIYYPEVYAVDWIKIQSGANFKGDGTKNSDYYAYDQNIYSVADGIVVESIDDIPDNTPNGRNISINGLSIGGNSLMIKSDGFYHYYAHLIPGSQTVKIGDYVKAGQIIASLGNSGNSTEAHLHFHIAPIPYAITSNGIPYRFDKFILQETSVKNGVVDLTGRQQLIKNQIIRENEVTTFM